MLKFLIIKSGGRAGCGLLHNYLKARSRISADGERFNLKEKEFQNPQNWLEEIRKVYDRAPSHAAARGCFLRPNGTSTPHWLELRRQISLTVPDLRVIFLSRNYVNQYASTIAEMLAEEDPLPVLVDIQHLKSMFADWDQATTKLHQVFQHHSSLSIRYEDLVSSPRSTMALVYEFLGVSMGDWFVAQSVSDIDPANIVKNLDEVRMALADTPWAKFLS